LSEEFSLSLVQLIFFSMSISKWIFFPLVLNILSSMDLDASKLEDLLPHSVLGWQPTEKERYYNPETLYDYIDGGAELYISYGFKEVISRIYSKPDQPDIIVEVFDMVEAKNAFGVFSHVREDIDYSYGQGSQVLEGAILFWKDQYYVSVISYDETESSGAAIHKLARDIDSLIIGEGQLPDILKLLPVNGLVEESILYFFHPAWLNSFYYISDENILNINEKTNCILAKYNAPENRNYLLIVEYPEKKDALITLENFCENYSEEIQTLHAVEIEEGNWTACDSINNIFIGVFNARSKNQALELINQVREKSKKNI
jgi:hypothetical protein